MFTPALVRSGSEARALLIQYTEEFTPVDSAFIVEPEDLGQLPFVMIQTPLWLSEGGRFTAAFFPYVNQVWLYNAKLEPTLTIDGCLPKKLKDFYRDQLEKSPREPHAAVILTAAVTYRASIEESTCFRRSRPLESYTTSMSSTGTVIR